MGSLSRRFIAVRERHCYRSSTPSCMQEVASCQYGTTEHQAEQRDGNNTPCALATRLGLTRSSACHSIGIHPGGCHLRRRQAPSCLPLPTPLTKSDYSSHWHGTSLIYRLATDLTGVYCGTVPERQNRSWPNITRPANSWLKGEWSYNQRAVPARPLIGTVGATLSA